MISNTIQSILDLQQAYSPQPSQAMNNRRLLVEQQLVSEVRQALEMNSVGPQWQVNASSGIGNNAKVPWLRIFNPDQSKSAQSGWYVVFLFAADGSSVNLSLDLGVTKLTGAQVKEMRQNAISKLGLPLVSSSAPGSSSLATEIHLMDTGLGKKYEEGHVTGFSFPNGSVPEDDLLTEQVRWLLGLLELLPYEAEEAVSNVPDELEAFTSATGWSKARAAQVLSSLCDASPQVVLVGPPGTGKTFVAKEFARYLLSDGTESDVDDRVAIVQFHPSYGYEEFVEGLRPIPSQNGLLEFTNVPGVILRLAKEIQLDGKPRVLIIDEMNRANLPRVFGELLYLLEYRNASINLMYHGKFALPPELFVIGTMNTADRSIKNLDLALRRRFDFFEVGPDVDVLRKHYESRPNDMGELLFDGFVKLNAQIASDMMDRHHGIGHSYFMKPSMSKNALKNIWELQVAPLLEDYFFDRADPLNGYSLDVFWP